MMQARKGAVQAIAAPGEKMQGSKRKSSRSVAKARGARAVIKARPFDWPDDGRVDPAVTALLVIDLQKAFLSPEGYLARKGYDPSPLRAILPAVNRVIAAARAAGCLIVHTRQGYRSDLADMDRLDRHKRPRLELEDLGGLVRGSPDFEIVPEVEVRDTDIIIDKTANGAFTYTELEPVLRVQGITHLMLAGCTTDVCVHCTLREATDRRFQCLLIEDACASGDAYAHAAAVHMVTVEGGIFGAVAASDAVVAGLGRARAKTSAA
jgi:nicotinamidase-related amidase